MGVRLGECSGDPQRSRGQNHRAADVAAGAEHRVRTAAAQDPEAGRGRRDVAGERPEEAKARPAGQALDAERVELEAGRAREPLFDGVRPTGERDGRAAAQQRLGDRERGQDVPCRPAGGDQEPSRWTPRRHG